jgi:acetyl/propionyl-CoA carboxylase alpha subunit
MRQVHQKSELREAALRCRSEGLSSFGDGALICEQYLTAPRHVEVQILADKHKNVYAIGDRDCSVQRRHQKVIEEAPAPALGPETRKALHAAAVRLAAAVGYDSTGTVEFLVDWSEKSRGSKEQSFFFLEMNTRLQVEHPVTEEVFGLDLVEWQLKVAEGGTLPKELAQTQPRGHSIEFRVYAEDVAQGFFPSPGVIAAFRPATGPGIRWEIGLDELDSVTGRFDPMIAKLVVTADSRPAALARMTDAIDRTFLAGPANNTELVWELCRGGPFADGPVTTHYLTAHLPELLAAIKDRRDKHEAAAEALLDQVQAGNMGGVSAASSTDPADATRAIFGARAAPASGQAPLALQVGVRTSERLEAQVGRGISAGLAFWYAALKAGGDQQFWINLAGLHYTRRVAPQGVARAAKSASSQTNITAPVHGKVIAIKVAPGAKVARDASVFILESMKMEFEVKAAKDGVIGTVNVKIGDQVTAGQELAHWQEP